MFDSGKGSVETGVRLKALIVDDYAPIRKIVAKVLIKEGFDIVGEAADGAEALEIAARLLPDVITLDISMPGMDGLAALPELRKILPSAVIVMVTMHEHYERQARQGGADAYIHKSRVVHELIPAIRSACENSRASFSHRENQVPLASLKACVYQAWRDYEALLRESGEAIGLSLDLQAETPPTADGRSPQRSLRNSIKPSTRLCANTSMRWPN
jgi:CheY-like chemotaxis protein